MNDRQLTIEKTLFFLALALAIALRFYNLGAAPLSDSEANWALQALKIAHGGAFSEELVIGPQPAYVMMTGVLFLVFGTSNFLARFWPALAGAFLVLLPLCFRRELGRTTTLVMAFGLAIDPGLTAVSRQAGGPMMALGFGLLAAGAWHTRKAGLAGFLGGLALLSGPAVITGLLSLGASLAVDRYIFRRPAHIDKEEAPGDVMEAGATRGNTRMALIVCGVTIVAVGTLFFRYPQGLAAWVSTLPAYLNGWVDPSGIPAVQLLAAFLFFEPLVWIFTTVGVVRWLISKGFGERGSPPRLLLPLCFALISLFLVFPYPGRQVSDLVWAIVPLWALAANELGRFLPEDHLEPVALLEAGLMLTLGVLFWNTLVATSQTAPLPGLSWIAIKLGILLGILALGAITTILVGLGWSWEAGRRGLVWGVSLILVIYSLGALWSGAQLRANQPQELWHLPPATGDADLLMRTLKDISSWKSGFSREINLISMVDAPSLRWVLRDYHNARFISQLPSVEMPDVIITRQDQEAPALTAAYRGQDFAWWVNPGWPGALPPDLVPWLTFRQAPLTNEQIILWARSDIFPGGSLTPGINQ